MKSHILNVGLLAWAAFGAPMEPTKRQINTKGELDRVAGTQQDPCIAFRHPGFGSSSAICGPDPVEEMIRSGRKPGQQRDEETDAVEDAETLMDMFEDAGGCGCGGDDDDDKADGPAEGGDQCEATGLGTASGNTSGEKDCEDCEYCDVCSHCPQCEE